MVEVAEFQLLSGNGGQPWQAVKTKLNGRQDVGAGQWLAG